MSTILISQRVDFLPDRGETRDALDHQYIKWITPLGYAPVPVPNSLTIETWHAWIEAVNPIGIILSGGNDIGQSVERDETERRLLLYAERQSLPVLGICRGMQMMVKEAGGEISEISGHVACEHRIVWNEEGAGSSSFDVNSYHNFGVKTCPPNYAVLAHAEDDGSIEAITHVSLPWEGWMWHPERDVARSIEMRDRLHRLFCSAKSSDTPPVNAMKSK